MIVEQDDSQVSVSLSLSLLSVLCSGRFSFGGLQEVGLAHLFTLHFHNIFHAAQCIYVHLICIFLFPTQIKLLEIFWCVCFILPPLFSIV